MNKPTQQLKKLLQLSKTSKENTARNKINNIANILDAQNIKPLFFAIS